MNVATELYNIPKGHSATPGNELGIFEALGDVYAQEDLDLFFKNFAPYAPSLPSPSLADSCRHGPCALTFTQ